MLAVCLLHTAAARLPESVCADGNVRYFAFGSNLLRSKMVGCARQNSNPRLAVLCVQCACSVRAACTQRACSVHAACTNRVVLIVGVHCQCLLYPLCRRGETGVLERVPALVRDHRLAFNLRMFPPLEPAMASIEPSAGEDCEGALYTLTRQGYDELWKSEGGAMERPGYEELVVTAEACGESVQAITLRAASARKLKLAQPAAALVVWPAVAALPTTRHASHVAGAVDAPGSRRAAERPVQEAHRRRRQRGDPPASA